MKVVPVTVITTVYNEGPAVLAMLDSVMTGHVEPAEVVVADGGSTDGTLELLVAYAESQPSIRVLTDAGGRSAGRNAAIEAASHDLIVCIDGGCIAEPAWLEEISGPLLAGKKWVGGFYLPAGDTALSTAIGLTMVYVEEEVVVPYFLPSARSLAFHRSLWREVGGFPENEQFGEDTAFGFSLRAAGHDLVFVPKAVVEWKPPSSLVAQFRTLFAWGRGDGRLGLRSGYYRQLFFRCLVAVALLIAGIFYPPLLLLAVLGLGAVALRQSRMKLRHMDGWMKWILVPLATVNGLVSSLAGYITGDLERRSRKRRRQKVSADDQLLSFVEQVDERSDPAAPIGGQGMPTQVEPFAGSPREGGIDRGGEVLGT
jgi:glycosyltransferase involved in cell wall biosynthesis